MDAPELNSLMSRLDALSRDYSETPHRFLLVIGGGSPAWEAYLRELNTLRHTHLSDETLQAASNPASRCFVINTPMQIAPEICRWLGQHNIAIYQLRLLDPVPGSQPS
jgi:hypothetical protein